MPGIPILHDLVIILAAAIVVILASHRLRIPPLIGLLLTGLLIGPSGLGLVSDSREVRILAEIGVVALLFAIGLEFSLKRLREIRRAFFIGGSLQASLTLGLVIYLCLAFAIAPVRSVFIGFLVVLSSTAIVLKLYGERRELETPQGKLIIGIILFQDFLVVPMIIVTPALGGTIGASKSELVLRFGGGLVVVALIFVVARYLMPVVLHAIVRTKVREVFVLGAVLACLGMAAITESLHFSLALGAFIAGLIISESQYSHQVVADVLPFRDVFNSIFFISIGMLLQIDFVTANLAKVLIVAVSLVAIKGLVVYAVVRVMMYPARTAAIAAASLAQVGEFSFVLANVGADNGLVPDEHYQIFIASAILTMMATPLMIALSPGLGRAAQRLTRDARRDDALESPARLMHHVIIVGFGVNGINLARVLREARVPYVIIDLDGDRVRRARQAGENILYGDVTRQEILEQAGIETARVIVLAISDRLAVQRAIRFTRSLNPEIHIIVRTRMVAEIDNIYRAGADRVFAEEFETSIEIFTRVLEQFHVPTNVIQAQRRVLRGERYALLRSTDGKYEMSDAIERILAEGATEIFQIDDESFANGKSVGELAITPTSGATLAAVVRGRQATSDPGSEFVLQSGDFAVLVGGHADIDRAFELLSKGS